MGFNELNSEDHYIINELRKILGDIGTTDFKNNHYHLIYFDAFAPSRQPEMWSPAILRKMYDALLPDGLFVTYCAQGQFKREMLRLGFTLEITKGPSGKAQMVGARK